MMARRVVLLALLMTGCKSWTMATPESFDGEPVIVSGSAKNLKFGPYALFDFQRDWTRGSGAGISILSTQKRRQRYEFRVVRHDAFNIGTRCDFTANEKKMALRGDWDFVLGEGAELACVATIDSAQHKLVVRTVGEEALAGTFTADQTYRVQGIGTSAFSNNNRGPVGGFHIFLGERLVVLVQILNDQRVLFARGLDEQQRDALAPAIAALLLLDETITEFD
jgi:hypothetical protein